MACAVFCVENKENLKWFLENVKEALGVANGFCVTLMSGHQEVYELLSN